MKVKISYDEWYPVYCFDMDYGVEVDVEEEIIARWKNTMALFAQMQQEMRDALPEHRRSPLG